jgi:hypothetical protein
MIILVQNLGHPFFCVKVGFYFGVVDMCVVTRTVINCVRDVPDHIQEGSLGRVIQNTSFI